MKNLTSPFFAAFLLMLSLLLSGCGKDQPNASTDGKDADSVEVGKQANAEPLPPLEGQIDAQLQQSWVLVDVSYAMQVSAEEKEAMEDMKRVILKRKQLHFSPDGTFTLITPNPVSPQTNIERKGEWRVTPEGGKMLYRIEGTDYIDSLKIVKKTASELVLEMGEDQYRQVEVYQPAQVQ